MEKQNTENISTIIASPPFECLAALFYFKIFSHPLNIQELHQFCQLKNQNIEELKVFMEEGVTNGFLYKIDGYYLLENKPEWITQRHENEVRARHFLSKTRRIVHLMRRFPFVEGIFLSGSTSKGVVPKDGDVDYFIMTKPGRLWLTRTMLVMFKKLFLLNSHRYFCINYLIDTDHLEIEEKNRFTATEIATLLPVFNTNYYQVFWHTNQWIQTYYPNAQLRQAMIDTEMPSSKIKSILEKLFSGSLGEQLDMWAMQLSVRHWQKKFKTMDKKHFKVALKSRPYVSKHHPQNFQTKVTNAFNENITAFEEKHNFSFKIKGK